MGGYGSGHRWSSKPTTGQALRLDVRWLARVGLIAPGVEGWMPVRWTRNGEPSGDITVRYDDRRPRQLILDYRTRASGEAEWTPLREVVRLERTPCHYGGERVWCRCPGCGSRRAVLYCLDGRFRCVPCNRLAYSVTREEPLYRFGRRREKILERLGAEAEWVLDWYVAPIKPKGMHWRTYERLLREWETIRDSSRADYAAGLQRLAGVTNRLLE